MDSESEESEEDDCVQQMLDEVRKRGKKARAYMKKRDANNHKVRRFEVGEFVSIKVPKSSTNTKSRGRLLCRITRKPHPDRYQVESEYGIIDRYFNTSDLQSIPPALDITFMEDPPTVSLQSAANKALSLPVGQVWL